MRYSFLALIVVTVTSLALTGQPVQGAPAYHADAITPAPAAPGVSSVPLPFRAVARLGQGLINTVEISPDSKLIAVGGSVGVTVYEAATLKARWSARGSVGIMKWSPDSALLASDMSGVSVWDGATGRLAYRLTDYSPTDLEWSPDSRRLVMASWNCLGLIWYLKAGTLPIRLAMPACYPDTGDCLRDMYAALSPDGRLYATTYACGSPDAPRLVPGVFIWDALTGVQKRILPDTGEDLKWLHDSTHLLVNAVTEWDTKTGQQVDMTAVANDGVPSPEGSFSLPSGEVVVWEYTCPGDWQPCLMNLVDVSSGAVLCNAALVSPDFKLCASQDGSDVAFSQITSGTVVRRIEDVSEIAALSPDWNFLVGWAASSPDDLNVWKVSDGQMIGRLALQSPPLNGVAWSPDGRRLAIVEQDGNVQLRDAITGQFLQELTSPVPPQNPPTDLPIRAAFSPDGSRLAVSGIEQTGLVIWDVASGQLMVRVDIVGAGMAWAPDGTEIALVDYDQSLSVVDAATGNIRRSTEANAGSVSFLQAIGVGWSRDGKQIAVGSVGGEIILYDAATLNKVSTLTYRTGAKLYWPIPYLMYSPDGRSLAAVIPLPDEYLLAIWDLASGRVRTGRITSNAQDGLFLPLSSLAWSPNGRYLAVGFGTAEDGIGGYSIRGGDIAIFSARTGQQVGLLRGHTYNAEGISFSPDSKKLASASLDGTALIWDLTWL